MRIPRTVNVMGYRWKVVRKPMRANYGVCDRKNRTIYLDTEITGRELQETFLHELMHACIPEDFGDAEEKMIGRMSPRLFDTLLKARWFW